MKTFTLISVVARPGVYMRIVRPVLTTGHKPLFQNQKVARYIDKSGSIKIIYNQAENELKRYSALVKLQENDMPKAL